MAGRPSDFKEEYCEQVERLCMLGLIDVEMAKFFDVSEKTFNTWKKRYPQFLQSIKKGKIIPDTEVALSLYKRAIGFEYTETTREKVKGKAGKDGKSAKSRMAITKTVTKQVAPDTGAQCFWLKNRQPDIWKDKQQIDTNITQDFEVTMDLG